VGRGADLGQKGEKGEPAVIEPVSERAILDFFFFQSLWHIFQNKYK